MTTSRGLNGKGDPVSSVSVGSFVRRRWTVIVTVVVVAIVSFSVYRLHGIFGSDNAVTRPSADALENTGYNPKRVLFEVFGSPGSVATINYLDEDAQPQRVDDVALPWSYDADHRRIPTLFANVCAPRATATRSAAASRQRRRQGREIDQQRERLHLLPGQVG